MISAVSVLLCSIFDFERHDTRSDQNDQILTMACKNRRGANVTEAMDSGRLSQQSEAGALTTTAALQ